MLRETDYKPRWDGDPLAFDLCIANEPAFRQWYFG